MAVFGKIIGGTIGFALGGPLGAIAGAAMGHAFVDSIDDTPESRTPMDGGGGLTDHETAEFTFFVATFSMLAKLVRIDGRVTREEVAAVEHFMSADLNLTPRSRHAAMNIFNTALDSPESFEAFAGQFAMAFRDQPQLLDLMLDILLRVAVADGSMGAPEAHLTQTAARIFGFSQKQYANIRARYDRGGAGGGAGGGGPAPQPASELSRAYAVLGCTAEDSEESLKKQYRKLVQDFHPDKIAAKGLPEEFTKFAQEKFQQIQHAYETVKKARGIL